MTKYTDRIDALIANLKLNYHENRKDAYWALKDVQDPTNHEDISHDLDEVIKKLIQMKECKHTITSLAIVRGY